MVYENINKSFIKKKSCVNDDDLLRVEIFQSHKFAGDQCIALTEVPIRGITENEKVEQKFKL